tara:strand:+ start:265 stop:657 length:393 start_codon:yes stop_codon:yes gene_type:complete
MPYINKSKSDNWGTPENIKEKYKNHFDPCPYEYEVDGLTIEWKDKNFVNPPFSKLKEWSKKINEEAKKGKEIVLLMPSRTDTKYFHEYLLPLNPKIEFIKGRVKYVDLDNSSTKPTSSPFPSILLTFSNT